MEVEGVKKNRREIENDQGFYTRRLPDNHLYC